MGIRRVIYKLEKKIIRIYSILLGLFVFLFLIYNFIFKLFFFFEVISKESDNFDPNSELNFSKVNTHSRKFHILLNTKIKKIFFKIFELL